MVPGSLLPRGRVPAENLANDRALTTLPDIGPEPTAVPGPNGHPLTLAELQTIARGSSPLIKQAVARVRSTHGAAVQAGLPPNPILAFEDDTLGTTGGAGYVGGYLEQLIKTGNKLQLARATAMMDFYNAKVALRRAEMDLATSVRTGYFNILVARENMRVTSVLAEVTAAAFHLQLSHLREGGLVARYEPRYLRVLSLQARGDMMRARMTYVSAWKQLAATLGVPGMPLTELAGRVDMPMPVFNYKNCLKRILEQHTDVLTAANTLQRARYALRGAQISPYPDVDVRVLIQKDYTGPPNQTSPSLAVALPLPVFNWNQGGIVQAQADLVFAGEEPQRARNDLSGRLAEAYGRYRSNRILLAYYRDYIIPDQIRVYNGVYQRYQEENKETAPNLGDVVVAQQLLIGSVTGYITTLTAAWQAVVDVVDLLQTNEMFNIDKDLATLDCGGKLPDFSALQILPGRRPCAPLKDPRLFGMDGRWPLIVPEESRPLGRPDREPSQRELAPTLPMPRKDQSRETPPGPDVGLPEEKK
jgi:cobalt-zinc-cadmium efflux system outer membrane protein